MLGRLGAQPILLPPLRERIEDLGRLCAYFLRDMTDGRTFEPDAFKALMLHDWPLNVRELLKVVTEAEVLSRSTPTIGFEHLPSAIAARIQYEGQDELEDTTVDPEPRSWRTTRRPSTGVVREPFAAAADDARAPPGADPRGAGHRAGRVQRQRRAGGAPPRSPVRGRLAHHPALRNRRRRSSRKNGSI